jgi:hypothetical protein
VLRTSLVRWKLLRALWEAMPLSLPEMWTPMGTRQVEKGEVMKRISTVILLLLGSSLCEAADRILMVEPPAAESLMNSIASACNEKDFQRFTGHFTPQRASAIRGTMEDLFIQHDLENGCANGRCGL